MDGPPPPPPPHGSNSGGGNRGGLPDGKYDIFIIPPHSAGGGFLYLPSLQSHRNSFLAGVASTLLVVLVWTIVFPVAKEWLSMIVAGGGTGMIFLVLGVGIASWALGKTQAESGNPPEGGPAGPGSQGGSGGPGAGSHGFTKENPAGGPKYGTSAGPPPAPEPQPQADPPPRSNPGWQRTAPDATDSSVPKGGWEKGAWEKAREETRRKEEERKKAEELRKKADELRKKREDEEKERVKQREKEAREREIRERREKLAKEREIRAKELKEKELKEKEAKEKEAREKQAKEKEAKEREAKERETKERVAKERVAKEKEAKEKQARDLEAQAIAARATSARSESPTKSHRQPSTRTEAGEETFSYRPYDRPQSSPRKPTSASSVYSASSYAASQSTARTTPPPSTRGAYQTKDPDKIVIKAVYLFNNAFIKLPIAQLVSGVGSVTDGLILRITTEGLFIDDDVRGVPQREWDVKAWTLKLVEVWCPQLQALGASSGSAAASPTAVAAGRSAFFGARSGGKAPTKEEADSLLEKLLPICQLRCSPCIDSSRSSWNRQSNVCASQSAEHKAVHILRANIRDQEGKRYVFVVPEEEGWKVAVGLQRLRKGTQVRALGVSGMPLNEAKTILENTGWA